MGKIKKGDIVGRVSYGKDILFIVEKVIKTNQGTSLAILKGLTIRIQADSSIEDLELIQSDEVEEHKRQFEEQVENRIQKYHKGLKESGHFLRENILVYTGKILHIDAVNDII